MLPEIIPLRIGYCSAPEWLTRRGGGWRPVRFPAGAVLIRHPLAGDILFDTGYGRAFFDATRPFPERLYRWLTPAHLPPDQGLPAALRHNKARPDLVILSHLHADHVAGLFDLPCLPPVVTSRAAMDHLEKGGRISTLKAGCPAGLRAMIRPLRPRFLEDFPIAAPPQSLEAFGPFRDLAGDRSLLAVPLPGHGQGQFGLFLPETISGPAFLIADAAWSRQALREGTPPPDSTLHRLGDQCAYLNTFTRLSRLMAMRPDISFWPSHCPETFPEPPA